MLKPSQFHDLVSGRRQGLRAAMARCALRMVEEPYSWVVKWRNHRYDSGAAAVERVGVPVVSVGNLTLGGTGKTPMVVWIAQWFRSRGIRVTVISRGYGAEAGASNDEARELEQQLPDVPHLQNPDRVAAAKLAIEELDCQLILLDDGFQHRRIGRDLDLVLIDAVEPFGFGHVFPRGMLREPLSGLHRADIVGLSRADMLDQGEREAVWRLVRQNAPDTTLVELRHAPLSLGSYFGNKEPVEYLVGKSVAAFCGIGNPAGFQHTLTSCGCQVAGFREFPDHHPYDRGDITSLAAWADGLDVEAVVCTQKDLVKLGIDRLSRHPLWAICIELELLSGRNPLEAKLAGLVGG